MLDIQDSNPYGMPTTDIHRSLTYEPVNYVCQKRQYKDEGEGEAVIEFELHNGNDLELGLINLIKSNTGKRVEFVPRLWFVKDLVSKMPNTMAALQNPTGNISTISPTVWQTMLGVIFPKDRAKAKKCRYPRSDVTPPQANCKPIIRTYVLPYVIIDSNDNFDRIPLLTKLDWPLIPPEAKERGAAMVERYFNFRSIARFDGDWFHVFLLYWARKHLTSEQMENLRTLSDSTVRRVTIKSIIEKVEETG
jgi:hypothetical protein